MPIRVQCACGKSMAVKDEYAGKGVKCPGCQQVVRVPSSSSPAPSPTRPAATGSRSPATPAPPAAANRSAAAARPAAARPAAARGAAAASGAAQGGLGGLFDEEGIHAASGPTCPACSAALKPGAVLCTHCGLNLQTGERLSGQQRAKMAEAAGLGHIQLDKAVADMREHEETNRRTNNAGMPGWFLAIMLVFVVFFTFAAVTIVNAASAGEDATGLALTLKTYAANPSIVWGCIIAGLVLQGIARLWLTVMGFMESAGSGLTTLFLWHKFLGQLSDHPIIGLVYALGFFTTLSGLGLMIVQWMA